MLTPNTRLVRGSALSAASLALAGLAAWTWRPMPAATAPVSDPQAIVGSLSLATQAASAKAGAAVVGVRRYERSRYGSRNYLSQRGSGVLVRSDGIVVTNAHVIRDASEVRVLLQDGKELDAEVLGQDTDTDLAILRIPGEDYPVAELATDRDPAVGEWVLAIGNPFGLDLTVTMGIVSGTRRNDLDIARYEDFIQTDAAINPGNSGGALVDLEGRLIGINTAMGTPEEGSNGIGYATPAWFVAPVVESILTHGRVIRGFLGVSLSSLSPRWADQLGYTGASRAVLGYAVADSPAERAGLERGDVIEAIDGQSVLNRQQVHNAIGFRRPGDTISLEIWRDGERRTVTAELAERGDD